MRPNSQQTSGPQTEPTTASRKLVEYWKSKWPVNHSLAGTVCSIDNVQRHVVEKPQSSESIEIQPVHQLSIEIKCKWTLTVCFPIKSPHVVFCVLDSTQGSLDQHAVGLRAIGKLEQDPQRISNSMFNLEKAKSAHLWD